MTTTHKSKEASEALYQGDAEKAAELFQEAAAEAAPPPVSTDELVRAAAEELVDRAVSMALANAAPLKYNATKIDMAKGLLASGLAKLNAVA